MNGRLDRLYLLDLARAFAAALARGLAGNGKLLALLAVLLGLPPS